MPINNIGVNKEKNLEMVFKELAYKYFMETKSEYGASIASFVVFGVDPITNAGTGAFLVRDARSGSMFQVPALMNDNVIKPFKLAYHEETGSFFPFTKEWVSHKLEAETNIGNPVDINKVKFPRNDVKGVATPPTGRGKVAVASSESSPVFPEIVKEAGNRLKEGLINFLKSDPDSSDIFMDTYSKEDVEAMLHVTKEAQESPEEKKWIFEQDSSFEELKDTFGYQARNKYTQLLEEGFLLNKEGADLTPEDITNEALQKESVEGHGWYKFYLIDGTEKVGMVIDSEESKAVDTDGVLYSMRKNAAVEPVNTPENSDIEVVSPFELMRGDEGFFIDNNDETSPIFKVAEVVYSPSGARYQLTDGLGIASGVCDPNSSYPNFTKLAGDQYIIPQDANFVKIKHKSSDPLLLNGERATSILNTCKIAYDQFGDQYSIDGNPLQNKKEACIDLVDNYNIEFNHALSLLKESQEREINLAISKVEKTAKVDPEIDLFSHPYDLDFSILKEAAVVADPTLTDMSLISSLGDIPDLEFTINKFSPQIEKGMSAVGTILYNLWAKETEISEKISPMVYNAICKKAMNVFDTLGELILKVNESNLPTQQTPESMS